MNQSHKTQQPKLASGKVSLVGAGPGDPELLTLKALRAIESADLILFDQLVGEGIKALFPSSVPAFYVGKRIGAHSITQEELNKLIVKKAKEGLNIVRLKGGDPYMFGRGGEEMLALDKAGIEVEVIPGITAAAGCAASTKIPLTHRGMAQGCTFVTGHGETSLGHNWEALAQLNHTLVFYMGLTKAADIQNNLLGAQMNGNTPVAIIENGSRENQREIITDLQSLVAAVQEHRVASPALIIVGQVVEVHSMLQAQIHSSLIEFAAPICA